LLSPGHYLRSLEGSEGHQSIRRRRRRRRRTQDNSPGILVSTFSQLRAVPRRPVVSLMAH
jgi:hypothetical protein